MKTCRLRPETLDSLSTQRQSPDVDQKYNDFYYYNSEKPVNTLL